MKNDEMDWKVSLTILLVLVPLRAWFATLGFGVLHNDWSTVIPALGFWACYVLSLAFAGVVRK
jgi:hypothetical protein